MVQKGASHLLTFIIFLGLTTNIAQCALRGAIPKTDATLGSAPGLEDTFGFNALLGDFFIAPTFASNQGNAVNVITGEIFEYSPSVGTISGKTPSGNFWVIFETSAGPVAFGLVGQNGTIMHYSDLPAQNYGFGITAIDDQTCVINLGGDIMLYNIGDKTSKAWKVPMHSVNEMKLVGESTFVTLFTENYVSPAVTSFQVSDGYNVRASYKLANVFFSQFFSRDDSIIAVGYSGSYTSANFNIILAAINSDFEEAKMTSLQFGSNPPSMLQLEPCGDFVYVFSALSIYAFDSKLNFVRAFSLTFDSYASMQTTKLQCHPDNEQVMVGFTLQSEGGKISAEILSFNPTSASTLVAPAIGLTVSPFKPFLHGTSSEALEKSVPGNTTVHELTLGESKPISDQFEAKKIGEVVPLELESTNTKTQQIFKKQHLYIFSPE